MKKIIAVIAAVLAFASVASAQSRSIGVRLGGDAEVSYQHFLGGSNFLEADLGFTFGQYGGLRLTGVYDFDFEIGSGFDFYVGPGAQIGMYGGKNDKGDAVSSFGIGVGGQLGLGYLFTSIPLNISLDWRPMWNLVGGIGSWSSLALGVRYAF